MCFLCRTGWFYEIDFQEPKEEGSFWSRNRDRILVGLFIASIGVAFLFSMIINSIGFSIAVGAFIAGIALNVPYNVEIIGKVKPLRDFFSVLFFVSLGMQLSLGALASTVKPLLILVVLVIILKPLIVMFLCSFFGYAKRTSF